MAELLADGGGECLPLAPASLHAYPQAGNASPQSAAGILSVIDNDGPKTADHLRIGIWNTTANITTYTIGNSWNDWVLYLAPDKLLEPSPYLSKGRLWLETEVVQVSEDTRVWEAEIRLGVKWHDASATASCGTSYRPRAQTRTDGRRERASGRAQERHGAQAAVASGRGSLQPL